MKFRVGLLILFACACQAAESGRAPGKPFYVPSWNGADVKPVDELNRERGATDLPPQFQEVFQRYAKCRKAMDSTLARDARYQDARPVDGATQKDFDARYYALEGKARLCASALIHAHTEAVRDACKQLGCGQHIMGGCAHIASYGITEAAIRRAVLACEAR